MNLTISTLKTTYILVALSVGYSLIDKNILHLTPILTVVLPYISLREKGAKKEVINRKVLSNIFFVNLFSLFVAISTTQNINGFITDLTLNITVCYIYHKITSLLSKRKIILIKDSNVFYEKFTQKICQLENAYKQTELQLAQTDNEKEKQKLKLKLETIKYNIEELKRQLELIKRQIESRDKKN